MTEKNKELQVSGDHKPSNLMSGMPEVDRLFDTMVERFFGPRFSSLMGSWPDLGNRSSVNIQENDKSYILMAEVPGIPKEDINISINGNLLTIRAEHREESGKEKDSQGYRRQYRSFQQSFSLPTSINPDQIEANYENGVLEIMLPKSEEAQPKRIEVQSGKGSSVKH